VYVGGVNEVYHYGAGLDASGNPIHSYAIGQTACNRGDVPVNWFANWNEHPVIAQTMYRVDVANGRFLQIGQSWLKHGFGAANETFCYSDCAPTNGTVLGVHCADTYNAWQNGDQPSLGPKSEVNPATGEYPYPWINSGNADTVMSKRLQVRDADLNLANNVYILGGQYLTHDDAIAGNAFNNQSWRRATVSSFRFTVADSTQRESPAIYAWGAHGLGPGLPDPDVTITVIDVPNDARQQTTVGSVYGPGTQTTSGVWCTGRTLLGSKVVQTSATTWRYEYALENLNCDRGIRAFQLPIPDDPNLRVLQSGFHGVPYHSGEPYDNTDWAGTVGGGLASWSGPLFAVNPLGNALRWGTTYSFWIECNASPATGTITLPLFKPVPDGAPGGTPTQMTVAAAVPTTVVGGATPPPNDACGSATTITNGTYFFSTNNATTDGPAACISGGQDQITNDVWFRYTSSNCTAPITLSTCGSSFDTKIAVYANACPTAAGSQIACSDDSTVCGTGSHQSSVTFTASPNTTNLVRVGGANDAAGTGALTISSVCSPPPTNDFCANAFWITDGVPQTGSTAATGAQSAATFTDAIPTGACGSSHTSPDVWYKYRPITGGTVNVSMCGSAYDTVVEVYSGACDGLSRLACNDDACGLQSATSFNGAAFSTYYIRVAGFNGATGDVTLLVTGGGGVIPPENDNCSYRGTTVVPGATPFSTIGATTDGAAYAVCNFNGFNQITNDIWFNYQTNCTGTLTVDTCSTSTDFDTRIAISRGIFCPGSAPIACNDDGPGCTAGRARVSVPVAAGEYFIIRVGGTNGATGTGVLTITCTPPCDPDLNHDGNADQDDVAYLVNVIAGGGDPTGIDPDFNRDGNTDQDDYAALVRVIAGGPCP
jgi:hypothetical protein